MVTEWPHTSHRGREREKIQKNSILQKKAGMITPWGSFKNSMLGFPCNFDQESAHSARTQEDTYTQWKQKNTVTLEILSIPPGWRPDAVYHSYEMPLTLKIISKVKNNAMKIGARFSSVLSSQGTCHSWLISQISFNRQTRECLCLFCLLYI